MMSLRAVGRFRGAWSWLLLLGLALFCWGALSYNSVAQSPTMDEQNHIARGYALLRTGDPRLSLEHPPLINVLEAVPLLSMSGLRLPVDDGSWDAGEWYHFADLFLWQYNQDFAQMVFLARFPICVLTLLLAALCARWARELWGGAAGLLAFALVSLDPNILAHGSLATNDLGLAFTVTLAGYLTWKAAQKFRGRDVILVGVGWGWLLSAKLTGVVFMGLFAGILAGLAVSPRSGLWRRRWLAIAGMGCVALVTLWATYAFAWTPATDAGPGYPLGLYARGLLGLFSQASGGRPAYFLGKTSVQGWGWYFPMTFALKTPLATLTLIVLSLPALGHRENWKPVLFLWLPIAIYWGLAIQGALNLGYRHLLPTLPLLYIWVARLARPSPGVKWVVRGAVVGLFIETLLIAPFFLSYFNPLAGGPEQGWRIVADSNIDWGQDLARLARYVQEHPPGEVKLSWFGSAYPEAYGIAYTPLPGLPHHFDLWAAPPFNTTAPEPGVYIISVSNLVEIPFEDKYVFAYFRAREPDVRIGYSIYMYWVRP